MLLCTIDLCQWFKSLVPKVFLFKIVLLSVLNTEVAGKLRRGKGGLSLLVRELTPG